MQLVFININNLCSFNFWNYVANIVITCKSVSKRSRTLITLITQIRTFLLNLGTSNKNFEFVGKAMSSNLKYHIFGILDTFFEGYYLNLWKIFSYVSLVYYTNHTSGLPYSTKLFFKLDKICQGFFTSKFS